MGGDDDQRPQVAIPTKHEGQDAERGQSWTNLGQDNTPVNTPFRRAINTGGVEQLIGHPLNKLFHQEDTKGVRCRRDN